MEGYIHQIDDAVASGERQSIKLDLFSCGSEKQKNKESWKMVRLNGEQQTKGFLKKGWQSYVCSGHRSASAGAPGLRWLGPVGTIGEWNEL